MRTSIFRSSPRKGTRFPLLLCLLAPTIPSAAGDLSSVPPAAPVELQLPDLDGRQRSLEEFRDSVVLVNFWASWCPPCVEEMPSLQRLAESMRDRPFAVIGINVAEGLLRVKTMVQRLGIGFPVLLDRDSAVFKRWGANVLPTTYLLDAEGVVRFVGRGPMEWDTQEIVTLIDGVATREGADKP